MKVNRFLNEFYSRSKYGDDFAYYLWLKNRLMVLTKKLQYDIITQLRFFDELQSVNAIFFNLALRFFAKEEGGLKL